MGVVNLTANSIKRHGTVTRLRAVAWLAAYKRGVLPKDPGRPLRLSMLLQFCLSVCHTYALCHNGLTCHQFFHYLLATHHSTLWSMKT